MYHLFVPYELSIQLKEKGFNESCFGEYRQWDGGKPYLNLYQDNSPEDDAQYTKECEAPLYQQVVDWFRDKHKLHFFIVPYGDTKSWSLVNINHIDTVEWENRCEWTIRDKYNKVKFISYYEALDTAIEESLKLI